MFEFDDNIIFNHIHLHIHLNHINWVHKITSNGNEFRSN